MRTWAVSAILLLVLGMAGLDFFLVPRSFLMTAAET